MAGAPDAPAAYNRKSFYQDVLRGIVINWSNCSNQGMAESEGKVFCECAPEPRLTPFMYCHTAEQEGKGRRREADPCSVTQSNWKVQGQTPRGTLNDGFRDIHPMHAPSKKQPIRKSSHTLTSPSATAPEAFTLYCHACASAQPHRKVERETPDSKTVQSQTKDVHIITLYHA